MELHWPRHESLARHSDVRMTMKYTHIGIEDQAEAVRKLPFQVSQPDRDDDDEVQVDSRGGRRPGSCAAV